MTQAASPGRRYSPPDPATWTEAQRALAARFTSGRRAAPTNGFVLADPSGQLTGPASTWVLSPGLGGAVEALGAQTRFELAMSDLARESVILAVAQHEDSAFERFAHEASGRTIGMTDADFAAIRDGGHAAGADAQERRILDTARTLLRDGDLDDAAYATAVDELGEAGLFELVTLVAYYRLAALQLRIFRVEP